LDVYKSESELKPEIFDHITRVICNKEEPKDNNVSVITEVAPKKKKDPRLPTTMKKGKREKSHQGKQSKANKSSVFHGEQKWWKDDNDPDLNSAIDKIESLQKRIDDLENENQLLLAENAKYVEDVKDL